MKAQNKRFDFVGTLEPPICKKCANIKGADCTAFGLPRSDPKVLPYIKARNCPNFDEVKTQ